MSYSILDLKNDLTGVTHNTQLNQITNLDGLIDRAARQLLLDVDPQETKRTQEFVTPIFNTVYDYPIADDVKGNKIIDIFPQVQRLPRDIWLQSYNQAFDVAKQNIFSLMNMFTLNFNTGLKTLRVNAPFLNAPVIIDNIEAISENGTWSVGSDASNLAINNTNFVQGAGSLQFDLSISAGAVNTMGTLVGGTGYSNGTVGVTGGSGTGATITIGTAAGIVNSVTLANGGEGYQVGNVLTLNSGNHNATVTIVSITPLGTLTNSTLTAVNLSSVVNQASFFTYLYFPTGASVDSVTLRVGSSSSNYYELNVGENQQDNSFVNGWNLLEFPWATMSTTGSPTSSSITYAKIIIHNNAALTGCLANGLDSILGTILSYEYYSKFLFRDSSTGAFQETVTDDSNLINLDTESYNLLFNKVAHFAMQQLQGLDATFYDGTFFLNEYQGALARYKAMYKSELQKPQSSYYPMPRNNYGRYFGRNWP